MMIRRIALALVLLPCAAVAGPAWDEVRAELFGSQTFEPAGAVLAISAPFRTMTDSRTVLGASVRAPQGSAVSALTLVLDENPMPVSAVIRFAEPQVEASFEATMRVNGPTPIHAVAELTDGRAMVAETFVKTSGEGACAAPPGTDPVVALATLGEMDLAFAPMAAAPDASASERLGALGRHALDVDISHPSHSGLQRDQVSLLFIPPRYVAQVAVTVDGRPYAEITGSISLAENPRLRIGLPAGASEVAVTMTDTEGTVTTATASISGT
jgi:sulfur-oxidizing protein SoxY